MKGHQGAVAVLEAGGKPTEAVIAQGNSRTSARRRDASLAKPLGGKGLKTQEAALLTSLPPPPRSFVLYFEQGTTTPTPQSHGGADGAPGGNRRSFRTRMSR